MIEKARAMTKNHNSSIVLGIDPGTCITGYAVIKSEGSNFIPIDFGCIKPPKALNLHHRYLIIYEAIEEIIDKYHPNALAIETQFMHKNAQSALKLGIAKGTCMIAALKKGISVFEYAPKEAKIAITGSGNATKEKVQLMLKLQLKLKELPTPEDAADALALAICHAKRDRSVLTLSKESAYVRLS